MNAQIKAVLFGAAPSLVRAALSASAAVATVTSRRWSRRRDGHAEREGATGEPSPLRDLVWASTLREAGTVLLDALAAAFRLELANLVWVDDDGRRAEVVAARDRGADSPTLIGQAIALDREASGVHAVLREGTAFSVFDAERSEVVNRRLNAIAGARSCVYLPVHTDGRVLAVVFGAVREPRVFGADELEAMQELVDEAAPALARAHAAAATAEALEREQLVARISLGVRSRRDLDESLGVALEQTARATGAIRCVVRLGPGSGEPTSILAEWDAPGTAPIHDADRLPVVNLAARDRRTVCVADVLDAPELDDVALGDVRLLSELGVRAVLSAPIVVEDRLLGVLALHRPEPTVWSATDVALAEAVAREVGIALDTRALLRDRERRLAEQQALLKAGQALTSDLRFDAVIDRLVEELRALVDADAADCWILLPGGEELVCRAVLGLPETEIGRRTPVAGTIAEALAGGRPVLRRDFARTEQPPPSESYATFAEVMVAPIVSFGEARGVLGVCSLEPGRFEESELRLIEGFASLASVAVRNAEAYEASTRQAQVERGFYRIAAVLSEPLSEQETVDAVAQAAAEALGGSSAAVLRRHVDELELVGSFQLDPKLAGVLAAPGESLDACARAGKVLAATRLRDDGRFDDVLARAAEGAGLGSLLAVPLPEHGDGAGVVLVFFEGERAFEDAQLELAGQVAAAARGALERSDLYERERRSRSLAQRLARAGRALAGELDPDNVLDAAVRHAVELLGADGASARVLEADEVVVRAASGAGAAEALETRAPSTGWLIGDVVQTRAARAVEDVRDDPRYASADVMLAAGYAGYLAVPMAGPDDAAHGILAVYSHRPRRWREEEADALHALAATAAAARSNAELYQGVSHEQQRSDAILANVADGIVAVDRDGHVVLWNTAAERITGVPAQEALGRTPLEALGRTLDADEEAAAGSRLLPIRRGGEEVWLSLSEAVMTDPAGAVAGRIYAFRDISAERSVERMKTDFVSTVSHELRTPLTSIFGFAETLLRRDVLFGEEERETFLRYIASESGRLTTIVDRLITVAQLDTGDVTVQLAETDVGAVVGDVVRSAEEATGKNGHRFVLDVDEGLAAEADREKLGQVLTHLLDNAVRYSPAGGTVTVAAKRRDAAVEVSVEDEGIGIPRAEQERIFRKFYRGEAASSGVVGAGATGLGLFLAERLVTAMGGKIRVDSTEGKGSTFVLELRPAESET